MAKINGSDLLVYADGTLIAYQKTCTVNWEQELPDTSNKESGGWAEHMNGTRSATCDFDALYSTTGLSADDLIAYITSRTSCILTIDGGGYPIVGEARAKNLSLNATNEEAVTVAGSFNFDGPAWILEGAYYNHITDPEGTSSSYDTSIVTGIAITSAVNASAGAIMKSNTFSVYSGNTRIVIFYLTLTSGQLPYINLYEDGGSAIADSVQTTEGVNFIKLTPDSTITANLTFYNDAATEFSTTDIYCFKI